MHYAVPRILHRAGVLEHLYTDILSNSKISSLLLKLPLFADTDFIKRLSGRSVPEIPSDKITAFEVFGYKYAIKLKLARNDADRLKIFQWAEKEFSAQIIESGFSGNDYLYTFNGAALTLLQHTRRFGGVGILEQTIAPKRIENDLLWNTKEENNFQEIANQSIMSEFIAQEEAEWAVADKILCGSDFVYDGLVQCGVDPKKCIVVPYGVDNHQLSRRSISSYNQSPKRLVNVLFIGSVGPRKGIWTLLRALSYLTTLPLHCRIVGPVNVDARRLTAHCPSNAEIVGAIPRSSIPEEFERADIFCLPSICEGSATVVYEALAAGLPVVTTRNSGSIVRHGIEGLIVPHSDSDALADAIKTLVEDRDYRLMLRKNATERALYGSVEAYSERLISAISREV
jgi:glycosyltransferase involved in cell wall biosynthesis